MILSSHKDDRIPKKVKEVLIKVCKHSHRQKMALVTIVNIHDHIAKLTDEARQVLTNCKMMLTITMI